MNKDTPIYPVDWVIIGYSLLMCSIILIVGRPISKYGGELAFYSATAALVALITRIPDAETGRMKAFFRFAYPVLLLTFLYTATGGTMQLIFDRFLDSSLTKFEHSVLGFNPTLLIDQKYLNVWITELLSFCYLSYYAMIPAFALTLFVTKRYALLKRSLATICLTFFLGYMLFFLYPIEGPRYHYESVFVNPVTGPVFRQAVEFIIANGAVRGGCMPSTHFAVALVILFYSIKTFPRMARILVVLDIGMAAGTVWGRFHYVSDVIVGGLIAVIAYLIVERYYDRWTAKIDDPELIESKTINVT